MHGQPVTRMGELQRELNNVDALLAAAKVPETRTELHERQQQIRQLIFNLRSARKAAKEMSTNPHRQHYDLERDPCRIHRGKTIAYALALSAVLTVLILYMAGVLA